MQGRLLALLLSIPSAALQAPGLSMVNSDIVQPQTLRLPDAHYIQHKSGERDITISGAAILLEVPVTGLGLCMAKAWRSS